MSHKKFYFTADEAAKELERRVPLRSEVERWWNEEVGCGTPPISVNGHTAILARHIGSFRYEDGVYTILAQRAGLNPKWIEYTGDKFVDVSPVKRSYLQPQICLGRGRNGGLKRGRSPDLAPIGWWTGQPLNTITTRQGQKLVDWHHEHQNRMWPGAVNFDLTPWLKNIGNATEYYAMFLASFVAHAVLFEDYHGGESGSVLDRFTSDVFERGWQRVVDKFGLDARPLIVPLPWQSEFGLYPGDQDWRNHGIIPESI